MEGASNDYASRLERLEESQMFADRRADLLSEQLIAMEQNLREAADRIRRLEENLLRLSQSPEDDQGSSPRDDPGDDLP